MARLDENQWSSIMDHLRQNHPNLCRQWFEQLIPVSLDGGLLRIRANTSIHSNYLQNKCREPFMDAAQEITGKLVTVQFTHEGPTTSAIVPASSAEVIDSVPAKGKNRTPSQQEIDNIMAESFVLQPDYSFDTFVPGPNNQMAYAAAQAVADQPGKAYNPLFIHGGVGLGKTHLLQAVCQRVLEHRPDAQILYVSCDALINQFIQCVSAGEMGQFRGHYRHVDVLVVDDIHFLSNHTRIQEEFFHTFNALYQANKQVILSSDASPEEIPELEDRLISRFKWGVVAHIGRPDFDTRVAILRAKAKLRNIELPPEVADIIARRVESNARELEGALNTLVGHVRLQNRNLDLILAREVLGDPSPARGGGQISMPDIVEEVTRWFHVSAEDLKSRRRHKSITEPRQLCMWLARRHTRFSLEEIGQFFGGRDHTTVMHSLKAVDERCEKDSAYAAQVQTIEQRLRGE